MYVLSDLFNGNVTPWCRQVRKGSEYYKAGNRLMELEDALRRDLTEEQNRIYLEMEPLRGMMQGISDEDCFIKGFRLGVRMILDVISEYHSQLPQL